MTRTAHLLIAIVFCSVMTSSLFSSDASTGSQSKSSHDLAGSNEPGTEASEDKWEHDPIVFSARDRESIRTYYRNAHLSLPPALERVDPGLEKQLRRNVKLSAGLRKRIEPLSDDLERRLHALETAYSRGTIGSDIIIVENRTQRVMDIFRYGAGR